MNVRAPVTRCPGRGVGPWVLWLAATMLSPGIPAQEVRWEDPAGDDHGPGTYVLPPVEGFRRGHFDLREVRIRGVADGVEIQVTWNRAPERVPVRTRTGEPHREVLLPVVDLYLQDPSEGAGHREVLPGRRVGVEDPRGWHRGVVLSALPEVLESHYRKAAPDLVRDLCFPLGLRTAGKNWTVRVPRRCLPENWALAPALILVTALGPGGGFQGMARGSDRPQSWDDEDPWVRRVDAVVGQCNVWEDGLGASPCAIGGCDPCTGHPFVLDLIAPAGTTQESLLRRYGPGQPATLPLVSPGGGPAREATPSESAPPRPPSRLQVIGIRGETLSLRLPQGVDAPATWPPGTLGALVCPGEQPGGTVVVRGVAGGFLVVERLPDGQAPCPGSEVAF